MIDLQVWKKKARAHYTSLPYHNFQHALKVLNRAEELLDRCKRYGIDANEDAVRIAALFHDAGYEEVEEYKEAHSASIAAQELTAAGRQALIPDVTKAILATMHEAKATTTEEKILRTSDVWGLAAEWEEFCRNDAKVREELALKGKTYTDKEWKEQLINTFRRYLDQDLSITPEHLSDRYRERAEKNLARVLNAP